MPATENPASHGKPNKKRAFEEISEARSMDDIGLETNARSLSPQTTCIERAERAFRIGHKDGHIQRFITLLVEAGFSGEHLRKIDKALNAAGVCIVPAVESLKAVNR